MSAKTTLIALGTALAIGAGAFATTASAAPLAGLTAAVDAGSAVETVKHKKKWHHHHGEAAIIGLGAFALGAAIASSQAQGGPVYVGDCYRQKVRVWSPKYQAYVIKTQTVCD